MKGVLLAATFSWGCEQAKELGISQKLKEYAQSGAKSHSEEEIKEALKKLFPYFYYLLIAKSNKIDDPFALQVVKAHWIGNELLENVKIALIKDVIGEVKKVMGERYNQEEFALRIRHFLKTGLAHHNIHAYDTPECWVRIKREGNKVYLSHLGEKRIEATPQDLKNLAKYGRGE